MRLPAKAEERIFKKTYSSLVPLKFASDQWPHTLDWITSSSLNPRALYSALALSHV